MSAAVGLAMQFVGEVVAGKVEDWSGMVDLKKSGRTPF